MSGVVQTLIQLKANAHRRALTSLTVRMSSYRMVQTYLVQVAMSYILDFLTYEADTTNQTLKCGSNTNWMQRLASSWTCMSSHDELVTFKLLN